jgi:hypothetical protein
VMVINTRKSFFRFLEVPNSDKAVSMRLRRAKWPVSRMDIAQWL